MNIKDYINQQKNRMRKDLGDLTKEELIEKYIKLYYGLNEATYIISQIEEQVDFISESLKEYNDYIDKLEGDYKYLTY